MYLLLLLGFLGALTSTAKADSNFIRPPGYGSGGDFSENPSYDLGQGINMQWNTDLEYTDLRLLQEYPRTDDNLLIKHRIIGVCGIIRIERI